MSKDIVLVDTPEHGLRALQQALRANGYTTYVVSEPKALLRMLAQSDCELVFFNLANGSTEQMCGAMRDSVAGATIPVIFIGEDVPTAAIRSPADALSHGGDYFFLAPLDMPRVLAKVQTYVGLGSRTHAGLPSLEDLDAPATSSPTAITPAAPGHALAGASDALLAQIVSRESQLAELVRQGTAAADASVPKTSGAAPLAVHQPTAPVCAAPAFAALEPPHGTLTATLDMAHLLCRAHTQKVTGRIHLEFGHLQRTVFFMGGVPVRVHSPCAEDRLDEYLYAHKIVDDKAYQQIRQRGLHQHSQIQAFVLEKHLVSVDALGEALHAQLKMQLTNLFAVSAAHYSYAANLCDAASRVPLRHNMHALMMQGIRSHLRLPFLRRRVGSVDTSVGIRPECQNILDALHLTGAELALVSLLDGNRSLAEVIALSGLNATCVYQVVYGMLAADAARFAVQHADDDAASNSADDVAAAQSIAAKLEQARMHNYFTILEVAPTADSQQVDHAFQALRQRYASSAFSEAVRHDYALHLNEIDTVLNEAHAVLAAAPQRALYARHLA